MISVRSLPLSMLLVSILIGAMLIAANAACYLDSLMV